MSRPSLKIGCVLLASASITHCGGKTDGDDDAQPGVDSGARGGATASGSGAKGGTVGKGGRPASDPGDIAIGGEGPDESGGFAGELAVGGSAREADGGHPPASDGGAAGSEAPPGGGYGGGFVGIPK